MNRLLAFGAASYAGLGVVSLLKPEVVPAVVDITAPTQDARTEIRAVYGGLPLAWAASVVAVPSSGTAVGVATAGMAAGRIASSAFEGRPPTPKMAGFIALEVLIAGALVMGARRSRTAA